MALAAAVAIKAKTEAADRVNVEEPQRRKAGHLTTAGYRWVLLASGTLLIGDLPEQTLTAASD
jgi:hypothetical protein